MVLNISGALFGTSQEFLKRGIRAATVLVAADGTGDTDTIEEAMGMLPSTGGVVYVKEGTYYVAAPITIPTDNVAIIGAGKSTVISLTATFGSNAAFEIGTRSGIYINNLFITGAGVTSGDPIGIRITTGTKCLIQGNWVEDCDNQGIYLEGASTNRILGNNIDSCDNGVTLYGASYRNIVSNNIITNSQSNGIVAYTSDLNIISSNLVADNDGVGANGIKIADASCDENLIVGNVLDNNATNIADSGTGTVAANNILS